MKRRALLRFALACVAIVALASGSALAYFSSAGGGTASAAVTALTAPTISAATAGAGGTVSLTWKAVTAPNGGTVTYYVTRNGKEEPDGTCPGKAEPESLTTCTDSGLEPGTYEYKVTALWSSWSKTGAVSSAKVTIGKVVKFTITGSSASPATGAGVNLTVTAKDSAGTTVTSYTGSHSFVFAGAEASAEGKAPTVVNSAGTATALGGATALTFTNGAATAASSKNGYLQIYKPGEARITVTEGSLTTPVPLVLNVLPTASRFVITADTTTPTAGVPDGLTIKAFDAYGNASTNYTGTHNLTFSGPGASPNSTAATVENSSGSQIAIGSTTAITFTAGVASAAEAGAGGELVATKSGANTLKAAEGSTVTTPTALSLTVAPATAASLALTASSTTPATTTSVSLTTTAKDAYGNTATSYTGSKNLTFTATGAGAETSPGGTVPGVTNSSGTQVAFGGVTAITFTNGVATVASPKNGLLRLYKPGSATITVGDGTFTSAALGFTVTTGAAKRVAFTSFTASAGSVAAGCFFTCTVTGLGNSGTITVALTITDEYGNAIANIGSGKTVTVASTGTTGSTVSGSPLTVAATETATTTTNFTYTSPTSGTFTNTITAASTGFTSATTTASK
jgi:hypothetical protein